MAEMMPSISVRKTHPLYTRLAIVGLLLYALVSLVFAILTVIDGDATTLGFFVISILLSVIFVGLMWRFGRWSLLVAAVWGALNLSLGWPLSLSLSYLNSFFNFVLPLLLTVGALLALTGAVVAFVQQGSGTVRRVSTRAERRTFELLQWSCWGLLFSRPLCISRG